MVQGSPIAIRRFIALLAILTAGLVGCSRTYSERYPGHLQYPVRSDYLVTKDSKPDKDQRQLPSPGELDKSIEAALREKNKANPDVIQREDPKNLSAKDRKALQDVLDEVFGTPAKPTVGPFISDKDYNQALAEALGDLKEDDVDKLALKDYQDQQPLRNGSALYRKHCLHCHGLAGDGRGPTGPWVHPHPRDYRRGLFKFTSTGSRKPLRQDLYRTLEKGIEGTSMPAFGLLPKQELEDLVSYVIHLSIRGETEYKTLETLLKSGKSDDASKNLKTEVFGHATAVTAQWAKSNAQGPDKLREYFAAYKEAEEAVKGAEPEEKAAKQKALEQVLMKSRESGYRLFLDKGGCIECHIDFGRQSLYKYDEWGTLVRPANLTVNTYRGGRRPMDLAYRVHGGIQGSGMSAAATLNDQEFWDVIHFIQALPYPNMLPEGTRDKIYPKAASK